MKRAVINGEYRVLLPDAQAEWDALQDWERVRFASMREHLTRADLLYDVGTEHGSLSVVYAGWIGAGRMVLIEPSPEFWPNIRATFEANFRGASRPFATWFGFLADEPRSSGTSEFVSNGWPSVSVGPLADAMPYRYLHESGHGGISAITLDALVGLVESPPTAITIDVEGAEGLVLAGAGWVLAEARPKVWCSIHPDLAERDYPDAPDVASIMAANGYSSTFLGRDHEEHWFFDPR